MTATEYRTVGRNADGSIMLRVRLLAAFARLVNVQFHVGGWPYGAEYRRSITYRQSEPGVSANAGQGG
jgi:hypothetical protein